MDRTILFVVLVVVVAVGLYFMLFKRGVAPTTPGAPTVSPAPTPIATAENSTPDAITNSLLSTNSDNVLTPAESDPTLTASNDQAVSSFDQTFDTSQF